MTTTIVWFRRDLRLADNPALTAALESGGTLIPVYLHDPEDETGSAARAWLQHSLKSLAMGLERLGSRLLLRMGKPADLLEALIMQTGATAVHWNRQYEPASIRRDTVIKSRLRSLGIEVQSHHASLLHEPWHLQTATGSPYRVYTPFSKAALKAGVRPGVLPSPAVLPPVPADPDGVSLEALNLQPRLNWDQRFYLGGFPGEETAHTRLQAFVNAHLDQYDEARNFPDRTSTSALSPHLAFGEISPGQIMAALPENTPGKGQTVFVKELLWREFAYHLLYHYPETVDRPLDRRFEAFAWAEDHDDALKAWQRGMTGIPLVDAGMRELWATGWMHNRVRMVVASFLSKNLLIPWQRGAAWFMDTLTDADLANNTLGWQWVAGCGADAAPYFRVFNPVLQAQRFDPEGRYIRQWIPELARLPDTWLPQPWNAPAEQLSQAGIHLGQDYPLPLVDLHASRQRALETFQAVGKPTDPAG